MPLVSLFTSQVTPEECGLFPNGLARRLAVASLVLFCSVTLPALAADEAPLQPPNAAPPSPANPAEPMWLSKVEPIFSKACFKCHGESKKKGGLDLRTPTAIFAGGTDGSVVMPGKPAESPLYQRLQHGVEGQMPPEKEPQLSVDEVSLIREWITKLPTTPADHPLPGSGKIDWNAKAPTLMELATQVKWQPPAGMTASDAIDQLIQARWQEQHVKGNDVADDRTFCRRIYLDLAGRIPTPAEIEAFVNDKDADKRAKLVDKLLGGSEYPRHLAEVLDVVLMERKGKQAEASRKSNGWFNYLESSVAANRPWNEIVAEIITARPESPEKKGVAWFLYERKNNHQSMAEAVAPVAFGVSIGCAQCHDHPLAHEIKQKQYWGLVAAFNRTANVEGAGPPALSEAAIGGFVSFTNLKKESQPALLVFPNDKTIDEKRPADGEKETDADDAYVVPPKKDAKGRPKVMAVPKFSRRAALAEAVTQDNPLLARAMVNRMWALLMGRGIVHPVDQMDSRHAPSHPELLAFLSEDFEKSGYNLKHLIRTIVLSKTYQLDSRWESASPPAPELFAKGLEKPLSAEVLFRSLMTATGRNISPGNEDGDTGALRQSLITAFPIVFEVEYNPTLPQTMFLTNNPLFDSLLKPDAENLTARLLKLSSNEERVRTAFIEVLGRTPDDAELKCGVEYLGARKDRTEAAVRQMTWALLTSAEFLLNH